MIAPGMTTTVMVFADAEWRMVRELFPAVSIAETPFGESLDLSMRGHPVRFVQGGWGKISASASTQWVLDQNLPGLLVNLGTCGGIKGRVEQGEIILAERTVVYDLIEQMSDDGGEAPFYATELDLSWLPAVVPCAVKRGVIASGDRDILVQDIPRLVKVYRAVAADWESAAFAWVARHAGVRTLILRGVSDLVGEDGGEAYGNYALFAERTRTIMERLISDLPDWLDGLTHL